MATAFIPTRFLARARISHCLTLAAVALAASSALAQSSAASGSGRPNATRAELAALAAEAEGAGRGGNAAAVRQRLTEGDFEVGDRIVLVVPGDSALTDTFTVDAGRTLNLPKLPPLELNAVLRSELHSHLARSIGRFLKDTLFQSTALMRFGVLGEVAAPGYYRLSPNVSITDALMAAGGPTPEADLPNTIVRRGMRKLMSKQAVRAAMVAGSTLDQIGVGPGDELVVAERRERGWAFVAQIAAVATGVLVGLRALR
jgi:hypothetical protein